jgi:hypothetical protein
MSWIEDAPKLMQDFVTPELRAITARMDSADRLATERHNTLLEKMDALRREVGLQIDLALAHRKLEELQAKQQQVNTQQPGAN